MKHAELRAVVHNVADSIGSGIGLLIGCYETDVYCEARAAADGILVTDLLSGHVVEGQASKSLEEAVFLYKDALAKLISDAGGSVSELAEAKVRFWNDCLGHRFAVTIEDCSGHRSTTEYAGIPGKRVKKMDALGRIRPSSAKRNDEPKRA